MTRTSGFSWEGKFNSHSIPFQQDSHVGNEIIKDLSLNGFTMMLLFTYKFEHIESLEC